MSGWSYRPEVLLLRCLLQLQQSVMLGEELGVGICREVIEIISRFAEESCVSPRRLCLMLDYTTDVRDALFRSWPEFSGSTAYPVRHPYSVVEQHLFASYAYHDFDKWDASQPYGQARRRLLQYMIDTLKERGVVA